MFQKFDNVKSFRDRWASAKRTVVNLSGRREIARQWFKEIEDVQGITFEQLGNPGTALAHFDSKLVPATLDATSGQLYRQIRRHEDRLDKETLTLAGRQALRLVYVHYMTDKTAKELYDITHLQDLAYPGDDHLPLFMEDWYRLMDDQEDPLPERQKQRIFYKKIVHSTVLKPYLDYYHRLDEEHEDWSYDYLLRSVETYMKKEQKEKNIRGLTSQKKETAPKGGGKGKDKESKKTKALAAKGSDKGGKGDPKGKGKDKGKDSWKGATPKGGGGKPDGSSSSKGAGKGDKGKGRGKGDKGNADPGPCFNFMDGKCTTTPCPNGRRHNINEADRKAKKAYDENKEKQRQRQKSEAAASKAAAAASGGAPSASPKAEPKAKGQPKPKKENS